MSPTSFPPEVLDEAMAAPMCSNGQPPVSTYRCGGRACLCEERAIACTRARMSAPPALQQRCLAIGTYSALAPGFAGCGEQLEVPRAGGVASIPESRGRKAKAACSQRARGIAKEGACRVERRRLFENSGRHLNAALQCGKNRVGIWPLCSVVHGG